MKRRRIPPENRIPKDVLDPVLKRVRIKLDYGIDSFQDYDWDCVRRQLPVAYQAIPRDDVRQQGENRRKSGDLKLSQLSGRKGPPSLKDLQRAGWYNDVYLQGSHWLAFREKVLVFWESSCSLCCSKRSLQVHHRRYVDEQGKSVFYREQLTDCVVLCGQCHKRHSRYMAPPPFSR